MPSSPRFVEMLTGAQRTGDPAWPSRRAARTRTRRRQQRQWPGRGLRLPLCRPQQPLKGAARLAARRRLGSVAALVVPAAPPAPPPTTTTTTTTLPSPAASTAAIKHAYAVLFDLADPAVAPKLAVVQDGSALKSAMKTALKSGLAKEAAGATTQQGRRSSTGAACKNELLPSPCAKVTYDILSPAKTRRCSPTPPAWPSTRTGTGSWPRPRSALCSSSRTAGRAARAAQAYRPSPGPGSKLAGEVAELCRPARPRRPRPLRSTTSCSASSRARGSCCSMTSSDVPASRISRSAR